MSNIGLVLFKDNIEENVDFLERNINYIGEEYIDMTKDIIKKLRAMGARSLSDKQIWVLMKSWEAAKKDSPEPASGGYKVPR